MEQFIKNCSEREIADKTLKSEHTYASSPPHMMDESASTSNNNTAPPTRRQKDRLEQINEDHQKLLERLESDYRDSFPEGIESYKAQGYLYEVTREPNESVNDWIKRRIFEIE